VQGANEEAKAKIRREFPGWSIITAKPSGRWWATRNPERDDAGRLVEHHITVLEAATPEELRAELRQVCKGRL